MSGHASLTPMHRNILRRIEAGPRWLRTFNGFKPVYEQLIADGLAARVKPANGRASNQLAITDAGRIALAQAEGRPS